MTHINQSSKEAFKTQQSCMSQHQHSFKFDFSHQALHPFSHSSLSSLHSTRIHRTSKQRGKRTYSPGKALICSMISVLLKEEDSIATTDTIGTVLNCHFSHKVTSSCTQQSHQQLNQIFEWQSTPLKQSDQYWHTAYQTLSQQAIQTTVGQSKEKSQTGSTQQQTESDSSEGSLQLPADQNSFNYHSFALYYHLQCRCHTLPTQPAPFQIIPQQIQADGRTTLMIRHIPNKYSRQMLLLEIPARLRSGITFLYLPMDSLNQSNMGYAFVSLRNTQLVSAFYCEFSGRRWRRFNSGKICSLAYARMQYPQGHASTH